MPNLKITSFSLHLHRSYKPFNPLLQLVTCSTYFFSTSCSSSHSAVKNASFMKSIPCFFSVPCYHSFLPHLLAEGAVATLSPAIQLVRLAKQWVEGLARAMNSGWVGWNGEGRHVAQLLQGTLALGRLVQQFVVLEILWQPLQHGNGLIEVHLQKGKRIKF